MRKFDCVPLVNDCWVPVPAERNPFAKNKGDIMGLTCLEMFPTHGTVRARGPSLPLVMLCVTVWSFGQGIAMPIHLDLVHP